MRYLFASLAASLLPLAVSAAGHFYTPGQGSGSYYTTTPQKFSDVVYLLLGYMQYAVWIIVSLSVIFFLWGVVQFIRAGGDEEALEKGKNLIMYGLLAIFVMVSVWGLMLMLQRTFFPYNGSLQLGNQRIPYFQTGSWFGR